LLYVALLVFTEYASFPHWIRVVSDRHVQSVHNTIKKNLEKIKGFSEVKVEKVKDAVRKCMVSLVLPCEGP